MTPWLTYFTLVLAGFLLLGSEIYVPGGVLGITGAVCLGIAVVLGFKIGPTVGWYSLLGILVFGVTAAVFWLKVFPRSSAGRRLTLASDGKNFKSGPPELAELKGRRGVTQTALRPAGVARIDNRRLDVISEDGVWVDANAEIEVARVSGSHLYVREVAAEGANSPGS